MIRATLYLLAAGAIWLTEGFLFSRLLSFSPLQVVVLAAMYVVLFCLAVLLLVRFAGRYRPDQSELSPWRYLSLAPMLVVVLGSFVSLPLLLVIALLGKWA